MSQRKKILVVDDDPMHLFCAKEILEAEGYDVLVHPRPFGATERVMNEAPDLVLLDVNMPALSGESLALLLRGREQTRAIPVILYSSNHEDALREASLRLGLGPDGFIAKGDVDALRSTVARVLSPRSLADIASGARPLSR